MELRLTADKRLPQILASWDFFCPQTVIRHWFAAFDKSQKRRPNMKRATLIIVTILLSALSGQAQVSLEVQGGLDIANLSDPGNLIEGAVWKSRFGFAGTASTSIQIMDGLLFSPGFRFVQKGTKSEWSSSSTGQVNAALTNNYLELPVYLKWEIADFTSKLFVTGGPTLSYLLSSRMEGTSQLYGSSFRDARDDYKSYDASFDIGLSMQTPLGSNIALLATGLYSYGLVKISDLGSNEQTRDLRLLIGISYFLKE